MTGTPVGNRPRTFVAVAIIHGVLAAGFAAMLSVLLVFLSRRELPLAVLPGFGFLAAFLLLLVVVFTAQTVNAITLLSRQGEDRGTLKLNRFLELVPYPTTRWSAFWVGVQRSPWRHPWLLLAYLAVVIGAVVLLGGPHT